MNSLKYFVALLTILTLTNICAAQNTTHTLIRQMFDGVDWVNDSKFIYTYDNYENLLSENKFLWKSDKWTLFSSNDYKYKGNLLVQDIFSGIKYGDFVEKQKTIYKYDVNKNQIQKEEYTQGSNGWTLAYKYRMYYNPAGKLIKRVMYEQYGDTVMMNFKTMYYYDDSNREIKMEYYSLLDTVAQILERSTTEYTGNTAITISKSKENYGWRNRTKEIKIFDSKGRLLSLTTLTWTKNDWAQSMKDDYKYDEQNNIIKYTKSYFEFDKWVPEKRENYVYSGKKMISKSEDKTYKGNWIQGYRTSVPNNVK